MPLNKTLLAEEIEAAFNAESDKDVNPAEARKRQSVAIANAFDKYLKAGTVQVTVTGSSATGGPVTGTGQGGIT